MLIMEHIKKFNHILCGNASNLLSGVTSEKHHISVFEVKQNRDSLDDCFHKGENHTLVLLNSKSFAERISDTNFTCKITNFGHG